jgi:hypothetical protein
VLVNVTRAGLPRLADLLLRLAMHWSPPPGPLPLRRLRAWDPHATRVHHEVPACRLGEHHRAVDLEVSFVEQDRPAVVVILYSSSRQGDGESLGEGGSVGESLGGGDSVGESLGGGGSVGESLGGGDSVGESLGEGDDVSLADGSVAVDVGAGGKAVVVGDGTGGVGRGSVAGGTSDPSFPAPIVGFVPITGAYRAVKACSRASGCNHRVTAATRSEGPADSSGDSGTALPGMTPTRSHQPITPFPADVRHSGCDATNTNRPATRAATYAKYKTFSHRSRSHRSRLHHGGRYGSRIHRIGASPRRLMRYLLAVCGPS